MAGPSGEASRTGAPGAPADRTEARASGDYADAAGAAADREHAAGGVADRAHEAAAGADRAGVTALPGRAESTGPAVAPARTDVLVRIHDLAGRPRGIGFLADHDGTLLTSHEAVDGLARLVLHAGPGRTCVVGADAVTALPEQDLALIRTEGLDVEPLPLTTREHVEAGTYVRIAAGCWREARVLAATQVTYTATDRFHLIEDALELAVGTAGQDALRLGGGAAGGPVLNAETGTVLGVLGTALHSARRDYGFAVPLRPAEGPLAELLVRNAATVPAYGADLNLAGVLELTATSVGQDGPTDSHALHAGGTGPAQPVRPVERADVAGELSAFTVGDRRVLGLVGAPGSGRTTELAALAGRRGRTEPPQPTLWLRGADLKDTDDSVADAARRALRRAARIVAASRGTHPTDLGDLTPTRLARLARQAGRPLLLLLDGPEEMPSALAQRLPAWTGGTADWLRATGARLVVACREEHWERAGAEFPADLLHGSRHGGHALPPCVPLSGLSEDEARLARARHGIPDGALTGRDARHPLTLRLFSEVRAALPDAAPARPVDRHEVFAAHLDLVCLRVAVRLAAGNGLRGTAVRRLAARVAGQVHEAARRSLGPGQGHLDRASFEELFPWGPAPARLGGGSGWASAVLTEGLLVPAGPGYRFAHEELADWIQGTHLDLDEALDALIHRPHPPGGTEPLPVPHHRAGPVVQSLLLLGRQQGPGELGARLCDLADALDRHPASWWAARLLGRTLLQVPDATPYTDVLRLLADHIVDRRREQRLVPAEFGPTFWTELPLPDAERCALLRRLVLADVAPSGPGDREEHAGERYLDAAARLLAADPIAVQPHLIAWFDDERPLPATPYATVATAAQALLHTHRHDALDELTEQLVRSPHPRADELLAVLAEDEPSAVCRAVDRWAHHEHPARRAAALASGLRVAAHAHAPADRELLRYAALALLARPVDRPLHGGALTLLVRDPQTRARYLAEALRHFADGDPRIPPDALIPVLTTHAGPVLEAFGARLAGGPDTGETLHALAGVTNPALTGRIAALIQETAAPRPEAAGHLAAYVDRRLDTGPTARATLLPLVTALVDSGSDRVRAALAGVLATPGAPASRALRDELLDVLLTHERDPDVLDAVLHAAAPHGDGRDAELRALVHRTGLLLGRTPDGATRFDWSLVVLARHVPGFAARMARWLGETPQDWAAVVGPSAHRMIENLAGARVPA
ncbi:trypsin-like peptidase domain-containing protein [Streptomyces collinus]|uniref:trypsin-like peptidase domain-containing protein n=1 Tax=Streptomyces collinus TaxID=42684 RepID=UPI00342F87C0